MIICSLKADSYSVNKEVFPILKIEGDSVEKAFYKGLELIYPKFYKMDKLSKLGVIGTEILKKHIPNLGRENDKNIALILSNSEGCAQADEVFEKSYQTDLAPSPCAFVYTLPNIPMGEIAIKNKWHGEHVYHFQESFNPKDTQDLIQLSLNNGYTGCIFMWINVLKTNLEAIFAYFTTTENNALAKGISEIELLINQNNA